MQSFMQLLGRPGEDAEQTAVLDEAINTTPLIFDHQQRTAFITDVARGIDDNATIAIRYGFVDEADMTRFVWNNKELLRAIKEERAIWFSSDNAEIRGRELARRGTVEILPDAVNIALNPNITPSIRLDAFRAVARVAGLDGGGRTQEAFAGAEGAARFSVVINLPGRETVSVTPAITPDEG